MDRSRNVLSDAAQQELHDLYLAYPSPDALVHHLAQNQTQLISFLSHMHLEGNESLAQRLLCNVTPKGLDDREVIKVETALRNRGLLNRGVCPDLTFKNQEGEAVTAHRSILALEAPYFNAMKEGFKDSQAVTLGMDIASVAYQHVLDYLYLSDAKREEFLCHVETANLIDVAQLADFWGLQVFNQACDEALCSRLGDLSIDRKDLKRLQTQFSFLPKFTQLLALLERIAGTSEFDPLIAEIQTPTGAANLAAKCTPKEIALFSTLKSEFGKACQIPPGAFGKAEWEKTFPIIVDEVPPLPPNIHAILEMEDPWEPGKKMKETCKLFLRLERVRLREENGAEKMVDLNFDGVEELAKKAIDPGRRAEYNTFDGLRRQLNSMPVAKAGWVLMRKEVVPGTRNQSFDIQQTMLKGQFAVPKVMDAILLNILTYASEGKRLYGRDPWTYTRCDEQYDQWQVVVGGFGPSGLHVHYGNFDYVDNGLSACWKF